MTTAVRHRPWMTAPRAFASVGLGLTVVGLVGTAIVRAAAPAPFISVAFGFGGATMVGLLLVGSTWALVGALLVLRQPANAVGWLMVPVGVGNALSMLSVSLAFAFAAVGDVQSERLAQIAGWFTVLLQLVGIFEVAIGFYFPTGRVQSRRWARFMWVYWAITIVYVTVSITQPGPLQLLPDLQNPFGFGPDLRAGRPIAPILSVVTVVVFIALAGSMTTRYRSAGRVERQQLKWFVLALGLSAIGLAIAAWEAILSDRPANAIGLTIYVFAGALVPIAIGIAILRYHLYDIDRIVSRTIAYGVVTFVLFVVFGGTIIGLQTLISGVMAGPSTEIDPLVVAASTLVVAALFNPVRVRVQAIVDRRFHRARYDAERTVAGFAGRLRDELDLATLAADLRRTTVEAVQPSTTGIWLRAGGRP